MTLILDGTISTIAHLAAGAPVPAAIWVAALAASTGLARRVGHRPPAATSGPPRNAGTGEPAEPQAEGQVKLEGWLNRRRENRTLGGGLAWGGEL
jgi:hypothetical protein